MSHPTESLVRLRLAAGELLGQLARERIDNPFPFGAGLVLAAQVVAELLAVPDPDGPEGEPLCPTRWDFSAEETP